MVSGFSHPFSKLYPYPILSYQQHQYILTALFHQIENRRLRESRDQQAALVADLRARIQALEKASGGREPYQ